MKLLDYLHEDAIKIGLESQDKKSCLNEIVSCVSLHYNLVDKSDILIDVLEKREKISSTGIGGGIAIPHGKSNLFNKISPFFFISKKGIDFESIDHELVYFLFVVFVPLDVMPDVHLRVLAKISKIMKDEVFIQTLKELKTSSEVLDLIRQFENQS